MRASWWRSLCVVSKREFAALAWTPTLWGVMALFALLTGSVTGLAVLVPGGPAELRTVAAAAGWAMLLVAPILSLRPTIEERRSGFWEVLATSPVASSALVGGRFVGGVTALVLVALVGMGAPYLAMEWLSRPDLAQALVAFVGVLAAGSLYLASGFLAGLLAPSAAVASLACLFFWMVVLVAIRSVAPQLPAAQADLLFAIDPVRRLETFLDGRLDSFAVAYFVCATLAVLASCACIQAAIPRRAAGAASLFGRWRSVAMALAWLACASAAITLAHHDALRVRLDATASRAWVLDPSTRELVAQLGDDWRVAWVVPPVSRESDGQAQVGEVLAAFDEARGTKGPLCVRIDPLQPSRGASYEQWIASLLARHRPDDAAAREAVDAGLVELDALQGISTEAASALDLAAATMGPKDIARTALVQGAEALRGLGVGAPVLAEQLRTALRSRGDRALPDLAEVAAVLAANHRDWSSKLAGLASQLGQIEFDTRSTEEMRARAARIRPELLARARKLMRVVETLDGVGPDALRDASIALSAGGAIVVESPSGIAVVSDAQVGLGADPAGAVRIDRRFRVEQLVAGAMRSVMDAQQPLVVIVHSGESSILEPTQDGHECAGIADALRTARIAVTQWRTGRDPRPIVPSHAVWIIVPPTQFAIEQDAAERAHLAAASALIAEGRGVMLSVGPSLRPLSGREDPWAALGAQLGVRALTDAVIVDEVPVEQGKTRRRTEIEPEAAMGSSLLCRALAGQRISLPVAVPVEPVVRSSEHATTLLVAPARSGRTLERDWRRREASAESSREMGSMPVAVAVERGLPDGTRARAIVVGSPNWMLSATADFTRSLGGGREALLTPGNRELAINGALWLAGLDARIGPSGSGREAPRIGAISVAERLEWAAVLVLGVPAGSLATGAVILFWRRRP